jgi:transposase
VVRHELPEGERVCPHDGAKAVNQQRPCGDKEDLRAYVSTFYRWTRMTERIAELASTPLVVGRKRDGRCVHDAQAKRELVELYHECDVSVAELARDCGVNANLLTSWIRGMGCTTVANASGDDIVDLPAAAPAFMPVRVDAAAVQQPAEVTMRARPAATVTEARAGCIEHAAAADVAAVARWESSLVNAICGR